MPQESAVDNHPNLKPVQGVSSYTAAWEASPVRTARPGSIDQSCVGVMHLLKGGVEKGDMLGKKSTVGVSLQRAFWDRVWSDDGPGAHKCCLANPWTGKEGLLEPNAGENRRSVGSRQAEMTQIALSPFLKWAGGKRWLVPEVQRRIPLEYETYYEPFLGGGAVFFSLRQKAACWPISTHT